MVDGGLADFINIRSRNRIIDPPLESLVATVFSLCLSQSVCGSKHSQKPPERWLVDLKKNRILLQNKKSKDIIGWFVCTCFGDY